MQNILSNLLCHLPTTTENPKEDLRLAVLNNKMAKLSVSCHKLFGNNSQHTLCCQEGK